MRKLILKCNLSPGDILMMTAAVRDLHLTYPGQFQTDVRTTAAQIWEHNPYITPLDPSDPSVEVIEMHYPLINQSNTGPWHFVFGYIEFLNEKLGLNIKPTAMKGDIHLSADEKRWISQVQEITHDNLPFWIIVAGGKFDFTIKWWDHARYQQVVDHFKGKIRFVQVGESHHFHIPLKGALNLVGKTDTRQLIRLMYHSVGVLCPVTFAMHLAAAVETKWNPPKNRACVVVAGGREPSQWEAYPHHRFLHTLGALNCCDNGGCWKARIVKLHDGDEKDDKLCIHPVHHTGGVLAKCMDMIKTHHVIEAIESYYEGGVLKYAA